MTSNRTPRAYCGPGQDRPRRSAAAARFRDPAAPGCRTTPHGVAFRLALRCAGRGILEGLEVRTVMVRGIDGEARDAVGRSARPIHGEPDLDRLAESVATARIVLIGEASHGTHELDDLRGTLTRKLIAEHGFAAVAIAGGWSEAIRVDRYVRG